MTQNFLIPLSNVPQTFNISLAGTPYIMTVRWNNMDQGGWFCDISDQSSNFLACNIPFITGADLLAGLEYLGIDGELIIYTNGNQFTVPTLDDLGVESNLYFRTSAASN